jgi:hypothetical protein
MNVVTRPRVLVFQPLFTYGALLDYRILGIQHWLEHRLTQLGFEGASTVASVPGTQTLFATEAPTDAEIRATLDGAQAQFGVLMSFAILGDHPQLVLARLYEGGPGRPFRGNARIAFDGEATHLPAAAFELLGSVAQRLGERIEETSWPEAFGTTEVPVANNYLTALGCHSTCEAGIPFDDPEAALTACMSGVHHGVKPHIDLLPALVASLHASKSAPPDMLAAAVEAAVASVAAPPASWRPMMDRFGVRPAPSLLN